MGVAIAVSCDNSSKEAWKGATISYKLLACIPVESDIKKDLDTRKLLTQFANQVLYQLTLIYFLALSFKIYCTSYNHQISKTNKLLFSSCRLNIVVRASMLADFSQ